MDILPVLCLLGVFCSLALAIEKTVPPEDLDGSGDDDEEDEFSGSGYDGLFVDLDSKGVAVFSTSISSLAPTVEGSTAVQEPEIADKEETKLEDATVSTETTKTHNPLIEDLFDVGTGDKEAITQEATTSPLQRTSTAEPLGETDTRKHHHHHHHFPPHHHTTTSSTSLPSESDRLNDTTDIPPEVDKPYDVPEKTTADTPDEESELHHVPQELTTPVEDLVKHGVLHEDTTSGSTSTYAGTEVTVDPLGAGNLPALDILVTTSVAEDAHKDHHHHHHPHHLTTTSSFGGSNVQEEVTTRPSDLIELDDVLEGEPTTTVAEDDHPHHGHHHHTHHHKTTPSTTGSTEPEQPHEVHTHEPKGRRVHVPDVRSTTAVPVINEEERIPEDAEKDDFTTSTIHYNVSGNPFDEIDDTSDSKEEGPSGVVDQDIFFEVTVPVINKGRMMPPNPPATDDGTSGASHGIMERKELLAGIIAGGVAGLVFAAFLVAFVLYRMKKKDEGSYSLEERKQSNGGYQKPREQREFYA